MTWTLRKARLDYYIYYKNVKNHVYLQNVEPQTPREGKPKSVVVSNFYVMTRFAHDFPTRNDH
jgi:hypothetical protein